MKTRFLLLWVFLLFSLSKAQNIGDFMSVTNGSWTTTSIWRVWNGTTYVTTTSYPGQTAGTYAVIIGSGTTVTSGAGSYNIGNLTVKGILSITGDFTLGTNTNTVAVESGTIRWSGNYRFTLSNPNAIITVSGYNGTNGLRSTTSSCNNNMELYIGTNKFGVCSGAGNSDYLFSQINNSGGTVNSIPKASPTEICQGSSTTLSGDYDGLISTPTITAWSLTSAPTGYTLPTSFDTSSIANQVLTLPISGTYVFSLKVTITGPVTGALYSNTHSVTVVVDPTSVGGTAIANQTICAGTQPNDLTLSGNTGTIQWQKSADNATFTDISGATASTLPSATIGTLTATTYFRAHVTSGTCTAANSNTVTITVNPNPVGGSVNSSQTICSGSQPNSLTVSGYTGSAIQWQKSTDNVSYTDISGATSATLPSATMGSLSTTTYYRAKISNSPCADAYSSAVTITVNTVPVAGTASASQEICSGSTPANMILTGFVGSIQWQISTDNSTFTDISGATSSTLSGSTVGSLTSTTYIRAKVSNSPCTDVYSNPVTLTVVNPSITGATFNLVLGQTYTLTGSHIPDAVAAWVSDNPGIVNIISSITSLTVQIKALAVGTANVTYRTSSGCIATYSVRVGGCYEDPTSPGVGGLSTPHGITNLGRAGSSTNEWPMARKGAYTALESKTKGFVITRVATTADIVDPIEGMIVYDKANDCLSIYDGNGWNCYKTASCP